MRWLLPVSLLIGCSSSQPDGATASSILKVRYSPLEVGDTIRAVGRSLAGRYDRDPIPRPLRVFQVGRLGVVAGVGYLRSRFERYGVSYQQR